MKKLIAGNWKMNGTQDSAAALFEGVASAVVRDPLLLDKCDMLVCPSFLHLPLVKNLRTKTGARICLGAQDCATTEDGAFTGDISAAMIQDFGCEYVIVGHSERRQYHKENNADVAKKVVRAHEQGLKVILCVGEKEDEREEGGAKDVVEEQLHSFFPESCTAENTVIAYEPVWAIGTGKTATPEDVAEMHAFIREKLEEKLEDFAKVRILYGGSVKPENAAALLHVENVDGALIGGASLSAESFLGIARAV